MEHQQTGTYTIPAKCWQQTTLPKKVLAIRLQAMGDVIITLPYLQTLRNMLPPATTLDFLTREEVAEIPRYVSLFDKVYAIGGGRSIKKQLLFTAALLPQLLLQRYDVVIDLQHNLISNIVRNTLRPAAWSAFDRFSPIAAGERTRLTIEAAGLAANYAAEQLQLPAFSTADVLLQRHGWDKQSMLVILNPAGAFSTRNWAIENYISFARLWLQAYPQTQFVITGIALIEKKAAQLQAELGSKLINLVLQTTAAEAFAVVQKAQLVLTEDSGLMHMAWVSGVPTLALFGSTRSDWSAPLGDHSLLLHSGDLPCGNCMLQTCAYGDNHCLTRYTPELVFDKAIRLVQHTEIIA
ncbi:glycosyltransferase family 9 protein [Deminuibacter soli]|uniref:Glycosyltransferase family 9 protein n=1 Tax=Deminuibacter soli TaxID=2291815 RepID=A0A3E1NK06_9BACT|nr:glycosyltransferase family 9 protein [Deminuibacter soli]RFM28267.1 glycosyltransferase family 9 protein [Deminuibacter soli]